MHEDVKMAARSPGCNALANAFQIAEIPDGEVVEEVHDEARGNQFSRSARTLRHGRLGIGQRSVGSGRTPGVLHREAGNLLPLSVVEELKVVLAEIAHDMAVVIANHHGDLDHGHARLERLARGGLGSRAGQQNQGRYESERYAHDLPSLSLPR